MLFLRSFLDSRARFTLSPKMLRLSRTISYARSYSKPIRVKRCCISPCIVRNLCDHSTNEKESSQQTIEQQNRERMQEYIKQYGFDHKNIEETQQDEASFQSELISHKLGKSISSPKADSINRVKKHIPQVVGSLPAPTEIEKMLQDEHGAQDIVIVDVRDKAPFADWLIVCSGHSRNHLLAIADGICQDMRTCNITVDGDVVQTYGRDSPDWMVVDVGHVVIHVMTEDTREYYHIESLWQDDKIVSEEENDALSR